MKTKLFLLTLLFAVGCNNLSNTISADRPFEEYRDNEIAAKAKYVGKRFVFSGSVKNIGKEPLTGKLYVDIGRGTFYLNEEDILNLHTGQKIKIEGTLVEFWESFLFGINYNVEDCHIVN